MGTASKRKIDKSQPKPEVLTEAKLADAEKTIRTLKAQIKAGASAFLTTEKVRREIFRMKMHEARPPRWTLPSSDKGTKLAVPCVNWSDWHWGEVVRPAEVNGINEYNLTIANARLRRLVAKIISLCDEHDYKVPGIVVNLGGDMVSGDIHEELEITNELPIMPVALDLLDKLVWALETLADKFKHVWVPAVPGNHGRKTKDRRNKQRQHTNFDWLVYQLLARHFQGDDRFHFYIPDGPDALYKVFHHRYFLTHGDNMGVSGGDGIIGAIGPIMRGTFKMGTQLATLGQVFDTVVMGHWHQYISLRRIMVNNCLKGFDEYAKMNRYVPTPASQALWWTHPRYGIGYTVEVFCDNMKAESSPWFQLPHGEQETRIHITR